MNPSLTACTAAERACLNHVLRRGHSRHGVGMIDLHPATLGTTCEVAKRMFDAGGICWLDGEHCSAFQKDFANG